MKFSQTTLAASPLSLVSVTIFFIYAGQSMMWPLVPLYATSKGASPPLVGTILLVNMLASASLSIPFGSLSDQLGRVRIITIGAVIAAGGLSIMALTFDPLTIILAYSLAGVGHAAYGPGTTSYPADIAEHGRMSRSIAIAQTSRQVAFSVGPGLAGISAELLGYSGSFMLAAGFMVVGATVAGFLLPEQRSSFTAPAKIQRTEVVTGVVKDLVMVSCIVSLFAMMFTYGSFSSFMPLYAERVGIPVSVIGFLLTFQALGNIASRLIVGKISDKLGKRSPFLVLGMLMAAFVLFFSASSKEAGFIGGLSFTLGLSTGFSTVIINTIMAERAPLGGRGLALGFFNTTLYAGSGIGPAVTGLLVGLYDFDLAFKASSLVVAAGALAYFLTARLKKVP